MGVDHRAVAGFTVKIPKENIDVLLDMHDDLEEIFDSFDIDHDTIGCAFSGNIEVVPVLTPYTVEGVDAQIAEWLTKINKAFATKFTLADVSFISEVYTY